MLNSKRTLLLLDITLAVAVAVAGGVFAWRVFDALGDDTLEWRFSVVLTMLPAPAAFASGHGMTSISVDSTPELGAFFRNEVSSFDPALMPEDVSGVPIGGSYAYMHFYLLYAIGWVWRLFGISFHSIHLLCIFLYMIMIGVLYGIFRLGMSRLLSVVGALIAAASPAYLLSCPSLRDFGKAPFMLLCFLLLGIFLNRRHTGRALMAYGALFGLVAGVGYGFRQDLLICVPAAIVTLLCFTQVEGDRPIRARLAAAALVLAVFLAAALPVIHGVRMDKGSASAQAFAQGVSEIMEDRMDFGYASYTMHHHYSDYFDFAVVNNYARRMGFTEPMPAHFSAGHGEAGGMFMREVVRLVPGDLFSRGLASLTALPSVNADAAREAANITQPHGKVLRQHAALYRPLGEHFDRWGLVYALAALLVLSVSNIRLGFAAALLCIYFGAYPSMLYEFRHFFHLAFVPYWAAGYLITQAFRCLCWLARTACARDFHTIAVSVRPRKRLLGIGALTALALALGATVVTLRAVQEHRMAPVLDRYAAAELAPVETYWEMVGADLVMRPAATLPALEETASLPAFESTGEYLALSLRNTGCPMLFQILYDKPSLLDFSQWCAPHPGLKGKSGDYLFFFPVYEATWPGDGEPLRGRFIGLVIPQQCRHAVNGLYRVANSNEFPLWPFLALPEDKHVFMASKRGPVERSMAAIRARVRALVGKNPKAVLAHYSDLIRRYPGHKPFETQAINYVRRWDNPREALELWTQLLDDFPCLYTDVFSDVDALLQQATPGEDAPQVVPKDPWSLTRRGLQAAKKGRHDVAAEYYRAALEEAPNLLFAAENLDDYLQQHQNIEARLREWAAMMERHPDAGMPRLFYGMALRAYGQFDEAAACFTETAGLFSEYANIARLQLAGTDILRGSRHIASLKELLASYPDKNKEGAKLCGELGNHFMEQQEFGLAAELFGMACTLYEDDMWPCVAQGEALAAAGETALARDAFLVVLRKAPESPYTAYQLHTLYEGDPAERLVLWRELTALHPDAAVPLLYLGRAQEDAGDVAAALASYREALQRNPSLEDAQLGIERLTATAAPGVP